MTVEQFYLAQEHGIIIQKSRKGGKAGVNRGKEEKIPRRKTGAPLVKYEP